MRLFVVGANPLTKQEEKRFQDWAGAWAGWWHWIDGFWMVVDQTGILTATQIRDALYAISPTATTFVLEVSAVEDWAGLGPVDEGKAMFPWIERYVTPDDNQSPET